MTGRQPSEDYPVRMKLGPRRDFLLELPLIAVAAQFINCGLGNGLALALYLAIASGL